MARRAGWLAAGWGVYVLGGPGVLLADGNALLGLIGVALWAVAAHRPARRAFLLEWLAASIGLGAQLWWVAYVYVPALAVVALGMGVYGALAGVLLRRIARRFPLSLAVPLAWTGAESLRAFLPPPFGLGWLRLGHYAAATPALSGSARVWGVVGLGFVLAAMAGLAAELWTLRERRPASLALGLGPLALALLLCAFTSPPATRDGPRLLLVQPAFAQARKQYGDPRENYERSLELTAAAVSRGAPAPDLVCWGETMLCVPVVSEDLPPGLEAEAAEWAPYEASWIGRARAALPAGTSFLSGAEALVARDGRLRRANAVALWDREGRRGPLAAKSHLVPGAETMMGLERFELVRDAIFEISAYVPDFVAGAGTTVLELSGRDGATWRLGATVCFDNAFIGPYTAPLRAGPLDFHLVVSNEAWYLDSCEMDQMIAFSRLLAIATGRAFVRATNAGVSAAFAPDGRELARLRVAGRDRLVAGTLAVAVPVPVDPAAAPPYVGLERWWRAAAILLPFLAALSGSRRGAVRGSDRRPLAGNPDDAGR